MFNPFRGEGNPADGDWLYVAIRREVQLRLLTELSPTAYAGDLEMVRRTLERVFAETLVDKQIPLYRTERSRILKQVAADVLGYGPIEPYLSDASVTEIVVNRPDQVLVERKGILEETSIKFQDSAELIRVLDRIVAPTGRRVYQDRPTLDIRLPDGFRVKVIIPSLSLIGPCFSLRKFAAEMLTVDDLIRLDSLTTEMIEFLCACVQARMNIVISGGLSTGKTTLLNALSGFLPKDERIISIEETAELQLNQDWVVRLESRPLNVKGHHEVPIRHQVISALHMRPNRIVIGDLRGGETWDILQAMNTGHDGLLTSAHSCTPHDTLHCLVTMALIARRDLSCRPVRSQIASAFDLIVHLNRLADGTRKVVHIVEVQGMDGDQIAMQDIFRYVQTGVKDGRVHGYFTATGIRPKFVDRIEEVGISVSANIFSPTHKRH